MPLQLCGLFIAWSMRVRVAQLLQGQLMLLVELGERAGLFGRSLPA